MIDFWKQHKGSILAGVITSVTAGLILAVILSKQLRNFLVTVWHSIQTQVTISVYWLLLIFISGLLAPLLILWIFKKKQETSFYDIDEYAGFVWEWDPYPLESSREITLLCPKCFTKLQIRGEYQKKFTCTCGFDKTIEIPYCILRETALNEFERRERTGDAGNSEKRLKPMRRLARKCANRLEKTLKENHPHPESES